MQNDGRMTAGAARHVQIRSAIADRVKLVRPGGGLDVACLVRLTRGSTTAALERVAGARRCWPPDRLTTEGRANSGGFAASWLDLSDTGRPRVGGQLVPMAPLN